jgi:hypothetical protein
MTLEQIFCISVVQMTFLYGRIGLLRTYTGVR